MASRLERHTRPAIPNGRVKSWAEGALSKNMGHDRRNSKCVGVGMAATEIRRRVAEMLQCRMCGQIKEMLHYFAPRAVVHYTKSREGMFRSATWEGVDALGSITKFTDENYTPLEYEILDLLVDGQQAVVRWRGAWRRVATGKIYMVDAAHFLRWEGDLVVEMHEFFERMSHAAPSSQRLASFEDLLALKTPGLSRQEMDRRARKIVTFPANGPEIGLIREFCSPEIVCDFVGDRARLPYAGRHVGIDALINIIRMIAVDFEQSTCEISEILIDGDRLAGRRNVEWRHRGTGRNGNVDLADFVRFENGLIVELIEFRDSSTLLEMQGERGPL